MSLNEYSRRIVHKETLFSEALGKERPLRIFVPPGYNELSSHRVVYCQDGEECFNFGRIATHATKLILDEGVEPFLVVGVDVDLPNRSSEYAPEGSRYAAYSEFFLREMMPFVESRYAVRTGPGDRVLVGDSRGGTVSLHLSLQVPDLIQKVISLSGAFLPSTREQLEAEGDLSWLRMYQLIGTDEAEVRTAEGVYDFLEANRLTRSSLESRGASVRYVEKPGKHIWGFWQQELPEALRWALADE